MIHIGFFHHRKELAGIRRQRFDVAALAFGVDRVERERGLARAGQAGNHDQTVARQLQIDIFQVVRAGAADADEVHKQSFFRLTEYYSASDWRHAPRRGQEMGAAGFDRKELSRYYLAPFWVLVGARLGQAVVKITTEECHVRSYSNRR